jgi:hypothetical protein
MTELCVSASDFRVHLKDLANAVAAHEQWVVMSRHGHRMVALVSEEDLGFLRKHKPKREAVDQPEVRRTLDWPDSMELEEVQRIYEATNGTTDEALITWRRRAFLSIMGRTHRPPTHYPEELVQRG